MTKIQWPYFLEHSNQGRLRKPSTYSSGLEIGWSLFASEWFGRLWTYQEGFLLPWVDLELGDGLVDLYSLIQNLY